LQQTTNLGFLPIDDSNVIAFVKESVNQTSSVVAAIALSRDVARILACARRYPGRHAGDRRHVAVLENLIPVKRHPLEWGGVHLRIDPMHDPALLFRCLADAVSSRIVGLDLARSVPVPHLDLHIFRNRGILRGPGIGSCFKQLEAVIDAVNSLGKCSGKRRAGFEHPGIAPLQ